MAAPTFAPISDLTPCYNQVGGHMSKEQVPETFVDAQGRFYKPFPADPKAMRELTFYRALYEKVPEGGKPLNAAYPCPDDETPPADAPGPMPEDVVGLREFVPDFYGTFQFDSGTDNWKLISMEDLTKPYNKACVMDCKMGFTTVYAWASEKYRTRNSFKDGETTQASCGFRVSGLQVYKAADDSMFKSDRNWGKTLTAETMPSAFELFASGGNLSAKEIYGHPTLGMVAQLKRFQAWLEQQRSFQFFQASLLLIYDGAAKSIEDAKVRIALVDFAYTFATNGAQDENYLKATASLISILDKVASA